MDLDFQSYNDNNIFGEKLAPMDYNFNKDVQEANLPATYPSEPTFDVDDEDDEI